jgi:hypothetical protein
VVDSIRLGGLFVALFRPVCSPQQPAVLAAPITFLTDHSLDKGFPATRACLCGRTALQPIEKETHRMLGRHLPNVPPDIETPVTTPFKKQNPKVSYRTVPCWIRRPGVLFSVVSIRTTYGFVVPSAECGTC